MSNSRSFTLFLLGFIFIMASCTKEGPAGPQGTSGPQGPPGPAGSTGATGAQGNSNIIYSDWVAASAWISPGLDSSDYSYDRTAPGITQKILDSGTVLSYVKLATSPNTVRALPAIVSKGGTIYQYGMVLPSVGIARFTFINIAGSTAPNNADLFRYIIIPGSLKGGRLISGSAYGYTAAQLRAMTYDQVASLFHLPFSGTNE